MLRTIAGAERQTTDQVETTELAQLCGYLPLALRIAAGKLATRPHWTVRNLVERLRDERSRLDQLAQGSLDVRTSIALSYSSISADAQQLLRRLGSIDLPEYSSWVAAAVLDRSTAYAEGVLDELFQAQLIEAARHGIDGSTRYRLHDLVRLFAFEEAHSNETPLALSTARERVTAAYLTVATAAYRAIYGGDYQNIVGGSPRWTVEEQTIVEVAAQPLHWFEVEQQSIVAIVQQAAADGHSGPCWELASTTSPMFQMRRQFDDWQRVLGAAAEVSRMAGDKRGKATILYRMGWLSTDHTDYESAKARFQESARLFRQLDDRHGNAIVTAYLGMIERFLGNYEASLPYYDAARRVLNRAGDRAGEAFALRGMAQVLLNRREYSEAGSCFDQAIAIYRACGSRQGEAQALAWQGMLYIEQRSFERAEHNFQAALQIAQAIRDRPGEAQCLYHLGICHHRRGASDQARTALLRALTLVRQPRPTHLDKTIRTAIDKLG